MKTGHTCIKEIRKSPVNRFDCTYHLSDGIHVRQMIDELPFPKKTCGEVSSRIFHAGRWKRVYVDNPNHGITLLGSSSMLKADLEDEKMVSLKYTDELEDKTLQAGWILISCSGTIGKTAYTNSRHAGKLASQHVIRLKPNDILGGGYVYAFLSSKYGYIMLTQGTFGAVIQHIEPDNVSPIPIPVFPEEFRNEVDGMIKKSARLREEAADALDQVHEIFNNEVLVKLKPTSSAVGIQNILSSRGKRFEASLYRDSAKSIVTAIETLFEYRRIGDLTLNIYTEGIFKREYVPAGFPFLMGSDILRAIPTASKYISQRQAANKKELFVKPGWILMTCSGSVGDVVYVDKQLASFIYTHDLIRIVPKDNRTQLYLFGFLSSTIGKQLVNHYKYGSVIQHLESFHVADIPVPILQENYEQIINLTQQYVSSIEESKQLELDAIAMVEAEIERWSK